MLQAEDLKGAVEQKVVKLNGVSAVSCASPEEIKWSVRYWFVISCGAGVGGDISLTPPRRVCYGFKQKGSSSVES